MARLPARVYHQSLHVPWVAVTPSTPSIYPSPLFPPQRHRRWGKETVNSTVILTAGTAGTTACNVRPLTQAGTGH
jgi:hypothetical protein